MTDAGRHGFTVAIAGAAMVLAYVGITAFGGGSEDPAQTVASDSITDRPLRSSGADRDEDAASASPAGISGSSVSTAANGAVTSGSTASESPRPSPTTWAQEVLAAGPDDEIRLTPEPSDWSAENIVIGKDIAGKFLGRVTVRYSGPGSAAGTFAVKLLKDGKEITTLTGELVEVRSGTYQVMLSTAAAWVEGPWSTQFAVVSTT